MSKRLSRPIISLLILLSCSLNLVRSQVRTTGQLEGIVADPSGAVVSGATLTISQPSTGFTATVTSNESGQYVFPVVQPGTYQLKASAKGFSEAFYESVIVSVARTTELKVALKVGEATETVRVSTVAQVLETTTNTLSSTISPETIENLPLGGRDVLPFAQLVPGAQSGGDQRFTTYNALPNAAINISVDGVNNNFQRYRTSTTGFFTAAPLREGAFDEVTVSTDGLTADAGAEGSVQLRFTTKRGTNDFHGSAFWQTQNSVFNANSFTNNAQGLPKSSFHLNDYGGSLGGPIWKNKVFFFFHYEEEDNPFSSTPRFNILTAQAQQGLFTYQPTCSPAPPWGARCREHRAPKQRPSADPQGRLHHRRGVAARAALGLAASSTDEGRGSDSRHQQRAGRDSDRRTQQRRRSHQSHDVLADHGAW